MLGFLSAIKDNIPETVQDARILTEHFAAGEHHCLAFTVGGELFAWGANSIRKGIALEISHQLGLDQSIKYANTPQLVCNLAALQALAL